MNKQTTVTALQAQMINKIARNEHTTVNGAVPTVFSDIGWVWASGIIESASDKGVFTSLLNVGLVEHDGNKGAEACVTLTETGFKVFQTMFPAATAAPTKESTVKSKLPAPAAHPAAATAAHAPVAAPAQQTAHAPAAAVEVARVVVTENELLLLKAIVKTAHDLKVDILEIAVPFVNPFENKNVGSGTMASAIRKGLVCSQDYGTKDHAVYLTEIGFAASKRRPLAPAAE